MSKAEKRQKLINKKNPRSGENWEARKADDVVAIGSISIDRIIKIQNCWNSEKKSWSSNC